MAQLDNIQKITIRPWPKMIFSWPTAVTALIFGFAAQFSPEYGKLLGLAFILVLGLNAMVLTFEFGRNTALSFGFCVFALIASTLLLNQYSDFLGPALSWVLARDLNVSWEFYFAYAAIHGVLFLAMFIGTRFNYWQLTPNELIHKRGIFGDTERFPTAGLRVAKEIHDIFEFVIAGAGRIILTTNNRQVVLENIIGITKIERATDMILGASVVRLEASKAQLESANVQAVEQS